MKKIILLSATLCIALSGFSQTKKMDKQLQKAREKQCKNQISYYTKGGWKVDGTAKTLEVSLLEYYQKLNSDPNNVELIGSVSACMNRNVCQNMALNNAMIKYAQEAKSFVRGAVESDLGSLGGNELDNMYAAYERLVQTTIEGDLKFAFAVYKEDKKGQKEYNAFYIINEDAASKKRIQAMQNAMKESSVAQDYGEKVSKYVQERFQTIEIE